MKKLAIALFACTLSLSLPCHPVRAQDKAPAARDVTKEEQQKEVYGMDAVVVTATRTEMLKEEVPAVVDVVDSFDLETTVGDNLTDVLKKNSSVDVLDWNGVLSGIGIRGFRPEYSGITKHYLVLIDGRPAGTTNLATILKGNVERIEVLKGPASSLYGAEAMGGVVNVITRKSTGGIETEIEVGGGSFATHMESVKSGGKITNWLDYDVSFRNKSQLDDYRTGAGEERPWTSFEERQWSARLGSSFLDNWRIDAKADWYNAPEAQCPNAVFYGDTRATIKDVDRYGGDVSVSGQWGRNLTRATFFASHEESDYTYAYSGQPVYRGNFIEYGWLGAQIQNTYNLWDHHDLTVGLDYQNIDTATLRWSTDGTAVSPYYPNSERENLGLFGDAFFRFWNDRVIVNAGARYDRFDLLTKETPLMLTYTPSSADFDHVSPRAGVKFFLTENRMFQAHATAGTAFVPPEVIQMAVYAEETRNGVTYITRGNPDLDPESSFTWDIGLTFEKKDYGLRADVTYFDTSVDDKITSVSLSPTVKSYANADSARMKGLEFELAWDMGNLMKWNRKVEFFVNATWMLDAQEDVTVSGAKVSRDIYNVADYKVTTGVSYDDGMFFGRFMARFRGDATYQDYFYNYGEEINQKPFTVCDLVLGVRFLKHHTVTLNVENIFDEYYWEVNEYALPGTAVYARYAFKF